MAESPVIAHAAAESRLLTGRYRLDRRVHVDGCGAVWDAYDLLLERRVQVRVVHRHVHDDSVRLEHWRAYTTRLARFHVPGAAALLDVVRGDDTDAAVSEHVDGVSLAELLGDHGPLTIADSVALGFEVATVLAAAHAAGLSHGRLDVHNIHIDDERRVRVSDIGLSVAPDREGDALSPEDRRADLIAFGVLLVQCLTGRPPRARGARVVPTRQLRAGIPPDLDDLLVSLLSGSDAALDAERVATRLDAIARRGVENHVVALGPAGFDRRWRGVVLISGAVAAVGLGAFAIANASPSHHTAAPPTTAVEVQALSVTAVAPSTAPEVASGVVSATAFDPPPGDGREHDGELASLVDGNPSTAWHTEGYVERSPAGKSGVGFVLVFDGSPRLGRLVVHSPTQDWSASVYVADDEPTSLAGWGPPVAQQSAINGDAAFSLSGRQGHRVLVWITRLGRDGPPFTVQVNDVEVMTSGRGA